MKESIEQIYTKCLAQGAYFVESEGEAFVIDPLRESKPYIDRAVEQGVKIKYIFETHFHADFVSGHIDLAKKTGATIVYGPTAETSFEKHTATDGEEFKIGKLTIKVLHTPGHTPESTTYLLIDEEGKEHAIFTGDTLFIGDVGRPDLAQKATNLTQEDLAGWLFDSLRNKIMPLPDDIMVYPAHGAGSSCGKSMSKETFDTLGNQKKVNYALRADMTKDEFIKEVTDGLQPPPQYFAENVAMNKKGYESIDEVMKSGLKAYDVAGFKKLISNEDVLVLDVRNNWEFVNGFVPGSIFIGLYGSFAPWVGAVISDIKQKIALITPEGKEEETVMRLARVGYDNSVGFLKGGFEAWKDADETVDSIESIKMEDFIKNGKFDEVIDVRNPGEYEATHLPEAVSMPVDYFAQRTYDKLDHDKRFYVHCQSGFRSTIAASILRKEGFRNFINVIGDFNMIKEAVPVVGSCPSLIK